MNALLESRHRFVVRQKKEWVEIVTSFETRNQYEITTPEGTTLGSVAEHKGGLGDTLMRMIFKSHRPLKATVFDRARQPVLTLSRKLFFFFSDLNVTASGGALLGHVRRRFGLLHKKYDLENARGEIFARIKAPRWRLWTFPIFRGDGSEAGVISKKWGGGLREIFTDADSFLVEVRQGLFSEDQKLVIFAAALSIDFDFFEDNANNRGWLRLGD